MEKITKLLLNKTLYKAICVSVFILIPSYFLCFFPKVVSAIVLLWGAVLLLVDLIKKRNFTKQTGSLILILFCIGYVITLLFFAENDLITTIHLFCWTIIEFFLLYAIEDKDNISVKSLFDEIYSINKLISVVSLFAGLLSMILFFTKTCIIMPDPNGINSCWTLGIVNGRNSGIFNNAIPCANAMFLGCVASIFNLIFSPKASKIELSINISSLVICFLCMITTLTRTYVYGVYFFMFIGTFAGVFQYSKKNNKQPFKCWVAALLSAILICGITIGTAEASKVAMSTVVKNIEANRILINKDGFTDNISEEMLEEEIFSKFGVNETISLKRDEVNRLPNFLYPRDELWKIAMEVIPHSPILGFSYGNRASSSIKYSMTDYRVNSWPDGVTTYHNSYFDTAVTAGLLGLGILLFFLIVQIIRTLRVMFSKQIAVFDNRLMLNYGIIIAYVACHVFITSMFFDALVFNNMCVCLYFWIMLGTLSKINDLHLKKRSIFAIDSLFKFKSIK